MDIVCNGRFGDESGQLAYNKLLSKLFDVEFTWTIEMDANRAEDGLELRSRFLYNELGRETDIYGPCSVLEMLVALSLRAEENIAMDDDIGDRTGQWFWGMITNLGLGAMYDWRYDERFVDECLDRWMNHDYAPNGRGGLFTVHHCNKDMRTAEIWYQLNWYLNDFL